MQGTDGGGKKGTTMVEADDTSIRIDSGVAPTLAQPTRDGPARGGILSTILFHHIQTELKSIKRLGQGKRKSGLPTGTPWD